MAGLIRLVYELNGPIRVNPADYDRLRDAWVSWKTGMDADSLNLRDLKRRENVLRAATQRVRCLDSRLDRERDPGAGVSSAVDDLLADDAAARIC